MPSKIQIITTSSRSANKIKSNQQNWEEETKWNLERIKSKENHVKEVMEQKFNQIDGVTGSIEDNSGKVKETLLDILNNDIGKKEIAPRKPWITEAMIKKMEERRIAKTANIKEYRRLNNQLRRETDRAKVVNLYGRDMRGNNEPSEERQI